ncbi:MAG TPA: cyclic nucleotide-binding domain-containing protein [Dehalococcoidia bacterium]|jgi:CRP-like cAMP-binding protein
MTDCAAVLRAVDIFSDFPADFLDRLAAVAELREYAAGATVVSEHEAADSFLVVTRGAVDVYRSDVGGGAQPIARLGPDRFFGELALLHGGARTATIRAAEASECLVLGKAAFDAELRRDPNTAAVLATRLARRINVYLGHQQAQPESARQQPQA